jgi:hypothetical protein
VSGRPYDAETANAKQAYADFAEREHAVALAELKLADIERDLEAAKTERARAIELEDQDAAVRHVDGDEAAPVKPQRVKRIAALSSKIPALTAAIPLQKARIAERRSELAAAQVPFTRGILEAAVGVQDPAVQRIITGLAQLASDLSDLVAADLIRLGTIGDRFSIPVGQPVPFAGTMVVHKFLAAIPPRLRPPELTLERIEARARASASAAICNIKEKTK